MPSNTSKVPVEPVAKKPIENPIVERNSHPAVKKLTASEAPMLLKKALLEVCGIKTEGNTVIKHIASIENVPSGLNTLPSVQGDGRHSSDNDTNGGSPYSNASVWLLLLTFILFILFLVYALANGTAAAYYTSIIFSYLLAASDILSIIIAAIALHRHEDEENPAKVVLIICGAALFLYLIGLLFQVWR